MNRISTRLTLAMVLVAITSLLAVPVVTTITERAAVNRLPDTLRERVEDLSRPVPPLTMMRDARSRMPRAGEFAGDAGRLIILVQDLRQSRQTGIAVGIGIALIVSVLLAWRLGVGLARPIEAVSQAASRVASGNLDARATLTTPERQPLEVQALAHDFNAMASSLERLEAERKSMIADVAHELRNPLATLTLRLDAAAEGLIDLDATEIATLQSQTQLLNRLVDDLRTLSLVEAGHLHLERAALDVRSVVMEAAVAHRPSAARKRVAVRVAAEAEPLPVFADRDRLLQVLGNLLENAIRVAPEGSDVRVEPLRVGRNVRITVRDAGPGFMVEPPERVFQRFVHGERSDRKERGSGLGLAIVRSLVQLHGGTVFARRSGEVTEVGFELPLHGVEDG